MYVCTGRKVSIGYSCERIQERYLLHVHLLFVIFSYSRELGSNWREILLTLDVYMGLLVCTTVNSFLFLNYVLYLCYRLWVRLFHYFLLFVFLCTMFFMSMVLRLMRVTVQKWLIILIAVFGWLSFHVTTKTFEFIISKDFIIHVT